MPLFLILLFAAFPLAAQPLGIAVAPLERGYRVPTAVIASARTGVETQLSRQPGLVLVERQRLEDLLKEARFQKSGLTEAATAVELGRLLNVHKLVFGRVDRRDEQYLLSLRLVDVASGRLLYAQGALLPKEPLRQEAVARRLAQRLGAAALWQNSGPMVRLDGGRFTMGRADGPPEEAPPHPVELSPFYLDPTEVNALSMHLFLEAAGQPTSFPSTPGHPATGLSWTQARDYCQAQDKRLPTEAEWEFAARTYAAAQGPAPTQVRPVNTATDPVGWLDGNVAEWVADWYDPAYYAASPTADPTGPAQGDYRVYRGASWAFPDATLTARNFHNPDKGAAYIGFRCARDAAGP